MTSIEKQFLNVQRKLMQLIEIGGTVESLDDAAYPLKLLSAELHYEMYREHLLWAYRKKQAQMEAI